MVVFLLLRRIIYYILRVIVKGDRGFSCLSFLYIFFLVFIPYACEELYFHLFLYLDFYRTAHDEQHIETNPEGIPKVK